MARCHLVRGAAAGPGCDAARHPRLRRTCSPPPAGPSWRRDALLGDPRTGPVDLDGAAAAALASPAPAPGPRPAGDTVAVTAVGDDGTAVTLIQSVFQSFGAGLLDPSTGIVLHNRGSAFSLDAAPPGRAAARIPAAAHPLPGAGRRTGDTVVALGCQGGRAQPWILAQVAADALAADDLGALVSRPRWVIGARDIGRAGPTPAAGARARRARTALDRHRRPARPGRSPPPSGPHDDAGHVQVARLRGGALDAASDPRADGRRRPTLP